MTALCGFLVTCPSGTEVVMLIFGISRFDVASISMCMSDTKMSFGSCVGNTDGCENHQHVTKQITLFNDTIYEAIQFSFVAKENNTYE